MHGRKGSNGKGFIYDKPINVYFESTRACDLACKHCRAEAMPERSPDELTTEEVRALLREVKDLGSHFIVSGGDPLKRDDLFDILRYAKEIGVPTGVTPTTSPLATFEALKKMKDIGIFALGVSLDGATHQAQDSFRGVEGTFENSMNVLRYAMALEMPVQVNTTLATETLSQIEPVYELLSTRFAPPVRRWSVFFLVPVGRGKDLGLPSEKEIMSLFEFLYDKSKTAPFHITTTEAPSYRAFHILKKMEEGNSKEEAIRRSMSMGLGVRDGNGVVFVSHTGDIYPSGFLNVSLGNVRDVSLAEIYRTDSVLMSLRDPALFTGKCGVCALNRLCGGSRARAYAVSDDYLAEDPICPIEQDVLTQLSA